jgi:hypothetical protein
VISFYQVNCWKDSAASQAVIEWLHVGQRVPLRNCDCIEAVVVTAEEPRAVLLGDQLEQGLPGWVWATNNTCFSSARNSSSTMQRFSAADKKSNLKIYPENQTETLSESPSWDSLAIGPTSRGRAHGWLCGSMRQNG